jgi:hypothetical protein
LFSNDYPPEIVGELTKDVLFWCPERGVIGEETLRRLENYSKSRPWLHMKSESVNCNICNKKAYEKITVEDWSMVGTYEGHVGYISYYYPPKGRFYLAKMVIKLDSEAIKPALVKNLSERFKKIQIDPERYSEIIYEAFRKSVLKEFNLCQECGERKDVEKFLKEKINPYKYFPEISELFDVTPYVSIKVELHRYVPGKIF